jgi:hypothetical protein
MMNLKRAFLHESKRTLTKINLTLYLIFFALLLLVLQDGISSYKSTLDDKDIFQETEKLKVQQYVLYTHYGAYGIRLKVIPSPLSVIFNNTSVFEDLIANVDSGERLNIYNSFKGGSIFSSKFDDYMDFAGIIVLLGCFLTMAYGFQSFRDKAHLNFLCSLSKSRTVFVSILLVRIVIINLGALLIMAISLGWLAINGIHVYGLPFLLFFTLVVSTISFVTILGSVIGSIGSNSLNLIIFGMVYFALIFLAPYSINKIVSIKSKNIISNYKLEFEKLKMMMNFERRFYNQVGIFKSGKEAPEKVKKLIRDVLKMEYKEFHDFENKMKESIKNSFTFHATLSALLPSTFYISACYELSSQGFLNFIDYYTFCQKMKFDFIQFYVDKKFFSNHSSIESFIKGDENIFYARSRIPGNLWLGFLMTFLYTGLALFFSYRRFIAMIHTHDLKGRPLADEISFNFQSGDSVVFMVPNNGLYQHFYNVLSGRCGAGAVNLTIDGSPVESGNGKAGGFLSVCSPDLVPGELTVCSYLDYLKGTNGVRTDEFKRLKQEFISAGILSKRFSELDEPEKYRVVLKSTPLIHRKAYMFNGFANFPSGELYGEYMSLIEQLKSEGSLVLNFLSAGSGYSPPEGFTSWYHIQEKDGKYAVTQFPDTRQSTQRCPSDR